MQIIALGLSNKRTPLAFRERLAFPPNELGDALDGLKRRVGEGAILSTCNRVELYAAGEDAGRLAEKLRRFWSDARGVPVREFEPYLYSLAGREAAAHLFRVACGLDSAILGESQILGQVRDAGRAALDQRSIGRPLEALFQRAVATGRRARVETGIGRNATSVSAAAVELARRAGGDLRRSRVLLVGAGKMGELAAKTLLDKGAAGIVVVGRRLERAERLALSCGSAVDLSRVEEALLDCDIVITCTSAPHHVIRREAVERVMSAREGRPLILIDIAVPRDVEPAAGAIPGVRLFNLDDLQSNVAANVEERRSEKRKVLAIIEEAVADFERWLATQGAMPAISQLCGWADEIRQSELARTSAVLSRLSNEDRQHIEALTLALQTKLLHHPIMLLREQAAGGNGLGDRRSAICSPAC
ncbi:MAG: glutamyl-tRNA reductase, partial [Dehalococcoidia bacterium]